MPDLSPDTWAQIRAAYEHSDRPVADICAAHGISPGTLRDRVRRWRWTPRRPPVPRQGPPAAAARAETATPDLGPLGSRVRGDERGELPQQAEAPALAAMTATPDPSPQRGGEPPDPAAIVARLQGAVGRVLPAIEAAVSKLAAGPQAPREMEQTARALGTMMRTLRELNALLAQQPPRAALDDDDDDFPEDIDEFRNELARRIDAFVESRRGEDFEADEAATCPGPAGRA